MLFKNEEQIFNNGQTPELKTIRRDILNILNSAVNAVNPYEVVKSKFVDNKIDIGNETIILSDFKNIYLIGFGKASVGMGQAVCDSTEIRKGAVVTNDPNLKVKSDFVSTYVGSHPIPNKKSIFGTEKILDIVKICEENDLLIVLISGGGSSLLTKPKVNLEDMQKTTDLLLKSGANINEINTIRKHLSFVKGGQLVSSIKCKVISFIISDIINDPIEFIASGPTSPDSTTYIDAKNIFKKYNLWIKIPYSVRNTIDDGVNGKIPETPKKNDSVFDNIFNIIVANNELACNAARIKAEELGYKTLLLTTSLDGEAKDIGKYLCRKVLNYLTSTNKMVFISGGETIVTVKGKGIGGRNQEMVLGSINEIANKKIVFSSFATDGIDGMSNAAGAIADGFSLLRAQNMNLNPKDYLDTNNSFEFFNMIGDLLITDFTGTNVMDIQIIVKIR